MFVSDIGLLCHIHIVTEIVEGGLLISSTHVRGDVLIGGIGLVVELVIAGGVGIEFLTRGVAGTDGITAATQYAAAGAHGLHPGIGVGGLVVSHVDIGEVLGHGFVGPLPDTGVQADIHNGGPDGGAARVLRACLAGDAVDLGGLSGGVFVEYETALFQHGTDLGLIAGILNDLVIFAGLHIVAAHFRVEHGHHSAIHFAVQRFVLGKESIGHLRKLLHGLIEIHGLLDQRHGIGRSEEMDIALTLGAAIHFGLQGLCHTFHIFLGILTVDQRAELDIFAQHIDVDIH